MTFVFTHDSIGLGEDGPTHQPIEQLASLRAMPRMWVVRPGDANEVAEAWKLAMNRKDGPTTIALSAVRTSPRWTASKYAPGVGRAEGRLRAVASAAAARPRSS